MSVHAQHRPPLPPAFQNIACVDCVVVPDCSEPTCPAQPALTEECTDQCVVIACDDPDHAPSLFDCTDCSGFPPLDMTLPCCPTEEYNQQPASDSRTPANFQFPASFSWEALDEMWCCAPPTQPPRTQSDYVQSTTRSSSAHQHAHYDNYSGHNHHPSQPPSAGPSSPHPSSYLSHPPTPQTTASSEPLFDFGCHWGSCESSFPSLPNLIEHLNYSHIEPQFTHHHPHEATSQAQMGNSQENVAPCLWQQCNNPNHFSTSPEALYKHLLNEHLQMVAMSQQQQQQQYQQSLPNTPDLASPSGTQYSSEPPLTPYNSTPKSTYETITYPDPLEPLPSPVLPTVSETRPEEAVHHCRWKGCTEVFTAHQALTTHIATAHVGSGQAFYECFWDGCTRNGRNGFQSKQKICRHVQSHTGYRPFQCHICNQNFSEAATLQQHIRRHTHEKPYVCDFPGCGKSFAITGALTIHKRTHNGDKPFKCTYCDRAFAESSNLSKHLRTHTGARPYVCPECNKAFARPDQLNRHKNVHRRQPAPTNISNHST